MGRMDSTLLFVRGTRSVEESLVLVRLFAWRWCNAQRTIIVRGTFLSSLATVAKEMDSRAANGRRLCGHDSADRVAMAFAYASALGQRRCCCWCWNIILLATQIAARGRVVRRNR